MTTATAITSGRPWPRAGATMEENARALLAKGIQPVVCAGKDAIGGHDIDGMSLADVSRIFSRGGGNLAALLGRASNGLVDVDITDDAKPAAAILLPPTAAFGRNRKPDHLLFYAPESRFTSYKVPRGGDPFLELRGDGLKSGACWTLIPPSVHANGDPVEWVGDAREPAVINARDLARRVALVACATLLHMHWEDIDAMHVAGAMISSGLDVDATCQFLLACGSGERRPFVTEMYARHVNRQAIPGWETIQLPAVVARCRKWLSEAAPPVKEVLPFKTDSDVCVAERLAGELRDSSSEPVMADGGSFYSYDDTVGTWDKIHPLDIHRAINRYDGAWLTLANRGMKVSTRMRNSVIETLRTQCESAEDGGFFANARTGFQFTNGFVQVDKTGMRITPSSADNRARHMNAWEFNRDEPAPRWAQFLEDIFPGAPDTHIAMQEFFGAAIIGAATSLQKCLVLTGVGSNGKSVLITVMETLFDRSAVAHLSPREWGNEYYRAKLPGIMLNTVGELPADEITNSEDLKSIIDGTRISGRQPRGEVFDFAPRAAHVFACNNLPHTRDHSHGFWRRIMVIPFNQQFDQEAVGAIPFHEMVASLLEERKGIMAWALRGAESVMARGHYVTPESSKAASEAWRLDADMARGFVKQCCAEGDEFNTVTTSQLYEAYQRWSLRGGHRHPLTMTSFGTRLKAISKSRDTRKGREYFLKLLPQSEWSE